jgi:hypothetical protein
MYTRLHALGETLTLVGVPTGLLPILANGPARIRESVCAEGAAAPPGRSRAIGPNAGFTAAARERAATSIFERN